MNGILLSLMLRYTREIFSRIWNNPNTKDPTMWAVWMIPTAGVGALRYVNDKVRTKAERLQRMLEETIAYSVGTVIFFTLTPVSGLLIERFTKNPKTIGFWTASIGTIFSTLYSGLWADKIAKKTVDKFHLKKDDAISNTLNPFRNSEKNITAPNSSPQLNVVSPSTPPAQPLPYLTPQEQYRQLHLHPHYGALKSALLFNAANRAIYKN